VETRDIFTARELTRNAPSAKIDVFSEGYGRNDLAAVTREKFPAVREALDALDGARMTGSGSTVFAAFATEQQAAQALIELPRTAQGRLVRTLAGHPLAAFAR
jgi:4-diphosphocytidyl-2-C-methyl-D-erythritol kinase